ncbi:hypothetical protein [Cellulomonas sp. S1-8]|uniref:hypothetical protein n=1 Tax=Cellulomonas sp. S1-8 TaxID=2904790 RepID=UPI00224308A7|nr:hypothetical protein [Cellulomonas sp. S1-8]UZN04499.1 hypothetical protein OKX07_06185 [Cellulomonas sp. S1-8]
MSALSDPPAPPPSRSPEAPTGGGWWRRNRWALVTLPVALALALIASGDRVRTMWWEQDLRRPAAAAAGETVAYHQEVRDGLGGTYPIDVQVHLDGVEDAGDLPDRMVLPAGTRAVRVDLTLGADPDSVLVTCRLAVRDADGTRYDYVSSAWGATQSGTPCVPADATGPWPSLGEELDEKTTTPDETSGPRPPTWSVSPVVVVPEDVDVTDVVLWWQLPQYVRLDVPGS